MTLFSTVSAATETISLTAGSFSTLNSLTLGGIVSFAINAVIIVAAVAFFFMLILGGIRWILSGGDKTNTEGARSQVTAAIIGLVIVFSAWIILNFVFGIFGVTVGDLNFGSIEGSTP